MNGESSARLWGAFLFEIDKATVSLMFFAPSNGDAAQ